MVSGEEKHRMQPERPAWHQHPYTLAELAEGEEASDLLYSPFPNARAIGMPFRYGGDFCSHEALY